MIGRPSLPGAPRAGPRAGSKAARALLPDSTGARLLTAASFVDAVGTGLYLAGSALFFTKVVGLSAVEVGFGQSIFGIAGLLGTVVIGRLADRFGGKHVVITLYLWQAICFSILFFARDAYQYYVLSFLIGIAEWGTSPVVRGLVAALEGAKSRVRVMAVISTVRNLGFALGGLLVTVAVMASGTKAYAALILGNACTFLIAAMVLTRLSGIFMKTEQAAKPGKQPGIWSLDPRFLAMTGLNGGLSLNGVLLSVGLPIWIATRTAAPPLMVGLVLVINTGMVICLQVLFSRGRESPLKGARMQRWAGRALAGSCLAVAFTLGVSGPLTVVLIVLAAALLTLGEISNSIGSWQVSFGLAPEDQRNYYLAVFELGRTVATTVGPVVMTWAVIGNGRLGWIGLMVFFVIVGELVVPLVRSVRPADGGP